MAAFDAMQSLVFLKRLLTSFGEEGNYFCQLKSKGGYSNYNHSLQNSFTDE